MENTLEQLINYQLRTKLKWNELSEHERFQLNRLMKQQDDTITLYQIVNELQKIIKRIQKDTHVIFTSDEENFLKNVFNYECKHENVDTVNDTPWFEQCTSCGSIRLATDFVKWLQENNIPSWDLEDYHKKEYQKWYNNHNK